MKHKETVLITGANGLLGSYMLDLLLRRGHTVYAIARTSKGVGAQDRILKSLLFWNDGKAPYSLDAFHVIEGEVSRPRLGISSDAVWKELVDRVEIIFHSAGMAKFRASYDEIRPINVDSVNFMLELAWAGFKKGTLRRFNHISTAYIAGTKASENFSENMLNEGQQFHNTYEQSKFDAEVIVNAALSQGLPGSIFRPSMVMGDSISGKSLDFRLFYQPMHFFAEGIFEVFPAQNYCEQNLINIDTASEAIIRLGFEGKNKVYNIVSPNGINVISFMHMAGGFFGFNLPEFTPLEGFDFSGWTTAQKLLAQPYFPYFDKGSRFDSRQTADELRSLGLFLPEIQVDNLIRILRYCARREFIRCK